MHAPHDPVLHMTAFMCTPHEHKWFSTPCRPRRSPISLSARGYIDFHTHERADHFLSTRDQAPNIEDDSSFLERRIYLDDLAVGYLQTAGIFQAACHCGLDLWVHPSMQKEQIAIIEANREGKRLADTLDDIRTTLRDALERGEAIFMPRHRWREEETELEWLYQAAPTVAHMLKGAGQCDAVCVDDRFFNRHQALTDTAEHTVPIVCVLDLLQHLAVHSVISTEEKHEAFHKLRQAGYGLVPVTLGELEQYVRHAQFDHAGHVIESVQMRILRQTLMSIRTLDTITLPTETPFLEQMQLGCMITIRRLWTDEALPVEGAVALPHWIWGNVAPSPIDWARAYREPMCHADMPGFLGRPPNLPHHPPFPPIYLSLETVTSRVPQSRYGSRLQFTEGSILSPHQEERVQALQRFVDFLGPTAPDFSALRIQAMERVLSDDEVAELFAERASGVAALQSLAAMAFHTNHVMLEALIPDSFVYFERFCGPSPGDTEHEEYLHTVLPQYRKGLLRHNLVRGLDICLQGALRDDLMPGAWTGHLNDDELWDALTACNPWRDPFALLGALDIALSRQHDARYQSFAAEAVDKLVQEEWPRSDGIDVYELLPLFAELALNRINTLEGGVLRPPCWKRMCAWMQAGFLVHLTQRFHLALESVREWAQKHQTRAGLYAQMLDLRHEPMYRAAEMSRRALRDEIVGRLVLLRERHKAAGRLVPGAVSIDEAISRLGEDGSPLGWALPGPLDGHRRPAEAGIPRLPEDHSAWAAEALATNPASPVVSTLAYLSQHFDLGEELLRRIRVAIVQIAVVSAETSLEERIGRLMDTALIACAQRDVELASAIASTVVATAHSAHSKSEIRILFHALLLASAAWQNETEWAEWLGSQLTEMALRLPAGEPSATFFAHLQELKKVLKLDLGIHARAEALASAAN